MIKIRPIKKSDKDQLLQMLIDFHKKDQRGKIVSKKLLPLIQYRDYDKHLKDAIPKMTQKNNREIVFVAEEKGKLIGYIYGRIRIEPKKVFDKVGSFEDWFVYKQYRNKKIGKMLWDKLEKWFKEQRCNLFWVDAYFTNKNTIKIYRKKGFIERTIQFLKKCE